MVLMPQKKLIFIKLKHHIWYTVACGAIHYVETLKQINDANHSIYSSDNKIKFIC